jgi:predicted nuclease of predicted toxin-antitoxin system
MKILVDMNLSPAWAAFLEDAGWQTLHLSHANEPLVKDAEVLAWARQNEYVLLTHDLDFRVALSLAGEKGPSIFQVSSADLMPLKIGPAVVRTLRELESLLESGALIQIEMETGKARVFRIDQSGSTA